MGWAPGRPERSSSRSPAWRFPWWRSWRCSRSRSRPCLRLRRRAQARARRASRSTSPASSGSGTSRYPAEHVRTANEIHIPVGEPVQIRATTDDVIHSFWVPELNRKIDMIPGRTNALALDAERAGRYRGQCAEFCGLQHAHMALLRRSPSRRRSSAAGCGGRPLRRRPRARPSSSAGSRSCSARPASSCHRDRGNERDGRDRPRPHAPRPSRAARGRARSRTRAATSPAGSSIRSTSSPATRCPAPLSPARSCRTLLDYLESLR